MPNIWPRYLLATINRKCNQHGLKGHMMGIFNWLKIDARVRPSWHDSGLLNPSQDTWTWWKRKPRKKSHSSRSRDESVKQKPSINQFSVVKWHPYGNHISKVKTVMGEPEQPTTGRSGQESQFILWCLLLKLLSALTLISVERPLIRMLRAADDYPDLCRQRGHQWVALVYLSAVLSLAVCRQCLRWTALLPPDLWFLYFKGLEFLH